MGNSSPQAESGSLQLSDREMARKLIDNKRKRSVQFSETPPPSAQSVGSGGDESHDQSMHAKNLRSNLMRVQKDRDPMFFYEVIKMVGVGSMGSVAMVRKRDEVMGGSARQKMVKSLRRQNSKYKCFHLPVVGDLFRHCFEAFEGTQNSRQALRPLTSQSSGGSEFGEPSAASVTSKRACTLFALKSIHLDRVNDLVFVEELKNEIEILKSLDHPYIVRPMETFVNANKICIVMELCSGGDLYSRDPYTEEEAARIIGSIVSAVSFMHQRKIVHRDLKYENILFANDSPLADVKLIDFGLSKKYASEKELTEGVGTIYTMAPEVLKGSYTSQADLWSIGVVAYMLLSSQMPFFGNSRSEIVDQIMKCKYDFRGRRWKRVSAQAKELVKDLLVKKPDERLTADEVKRCMWLNKRHTMTVRGPSQEEIDAIIGTMLRYAGYSDLKKLALMVIAHQSTSEEIGVLRKVFQSYDVRKKGTIALPEFREVLTNYGLSDDEILHLFQAVDLDGTGKLKYTEFLAATIEVHGPIDEEHLAEAFDRLDCDDSGFISAENLQDLLGNDYSHEKIKEIIKQVDLTDDNQISYPEFLALWEDGSSTPSMGALSGSLSRADSESASVSQYETVEKKSMRADNEAESTLVARCNFVEGKKQSERKALDALQMNVGQSSFEILDEIQETSDGSTGGGTYSGQVPPEIRKLDPVFTMSELSRGSASGDSATGNVLVSATGGVLSSYTGTPVAIRSADI